MADNSPSPRAQPDTIIAIISEVTGYNLPTDSIATSVQQKVLS